MTTHATKIRSLMLFTALAAACEIDRASTHDEHVVQTRSAVVDASATASELAAINAYRNANYYADSDIQNSFDTALGEHIDCIPFAAQPSVKARMAQGLGLPPTPPIVASPSAASATTILAGGVDGTVDSSGNTRQCALGTVPKTRPTAAEIEAAGGLIPYQQMLRRRIRPHGSQNSVEHDCFDNQYPLNLSSLPTGSYCSGYNDTIPGAGFCGDYDHAVGLQTGSWLPTGATGFYGIASITSVLGQKVLATGDQVVSQFWMQTGACDNWYNGNNGTPAGQQCTVGTPCSGSNCAVQSMEVGWYRDYGVAPKAIVFFTSDGYWEIGCFPGQFGGSGCEGGTDPWIALSTTYYPGMSLTESSGSDVNEFPIEVWNGTGSGYAYYYVWFSGVLVGALPNTVFDWPSDQASGAGPMVSGPATYLQVGGEVFQTWPDNHHSGTSMVSDAPASSGYPLAAYHRNVEYVKAGEGYETAALTFLNSPTVPTYMDDDSVKGLCGLYAGSFVDQNGTTHGYTTSTTTAAGGSGWNEYFYIGTTGN